MSTAGWTYYVKVGSLTKTGWSADPKIRLSQFAGRRVYRAISTLAMVLVVLVGLSGCSRTPTPRTSGIERSSGDVLAALKGIPGVELAQLNGGPVGLPGQVEFGAGLALTLDYSNDTTALLDYILRQLWSQGTTEPTTDVTVGIQLGQGSGATILDLGAAFSTLGLTNGSTRHFAVSAKEMKDHYGGWPGPVPTFPASLATATSSAAPTT